MTAKLLGGSQSSGRLAKTSTPAGSRPVSSSASRRAAASGGGVGVVDLAAGEAHLARVGAHVVGALGEQQVGTLGALAEEHQHRALAGVGGRRGHEPADVLGGDGARALTDRLEPVGKAHQPETLR